MSVRDAPKPLPSNPYGQRDDSQFYAIGVALGSPTHPYGSGTSNDRSIPRTMTTVTSTGNNEMGKSSGLTRSRSKKWAFLGRSKSKRINNSAPGGESSAQPSTVTNANASVGANAYTPNRRPEPAVVIPSAGRPGDKQRQKPPVARSTTHPGVDSRFAIQNAVDKAGSASVATPKLDVEIPDIKLERYSVMFKGLFQNQQSSTLLARRQATVSRLRAIEDEVRREQYYHELHRARRATTPTGMTPVLPAPPSNAVPLRLRSNTYPAPRDSIPEESHVESAPPSSQLETTSPYSIRDGEQRPRLLSKFHKPSLESIHSPYNKRIRPSREYQPSDRTSTERNTTPTIAEAPTEKVSRGFKTADIPKRSTSLNKAAQRTARDKEREDAALEEAVEVSIARQISISRQQRKLLKPFHERASSKSGGVTDPNAANSQTTTVSAGNKRLAATKKATPTFIHPESDPDSPQRIYRRSERVIVEGADA